MPCNWSGAAPFVVRLGFVWAGAYAFAFYRRGRGAGRARGIPYSISGNARGGGSGRTRRGPGSHRDWQVGCRAERRLERRGGCRLERRGGCRSEHRPGHLAWTFGLGKDPDVGNAALVPSPRNRCCNFDIRDEVGAPGRRKCSARLPDEEPLLQIRHPRLKNGPGRRKCSARSAAEEPLLRIRHPERRGPNDEGAKREPGARSSAPATRRPSAHGGGRPEEPYFVRGGSWRVATQQPAAGVRRMAAHQPSRR